GRAGSRHARVGNASARPADLGARRVHPVAAYAQRARGAAMTRRATRFAAAVVACTALGCTADRSALSPGGPAARVLANLGWPLLLGFLAVSAVMWGLIAWVAWRWTGTLEEQAPPDAKGGLR